MLYHYHSNSLAELAECLMQHATRQQSAILQPHKILLQNPGMKRWLQQAISRDRGIAANIEFPLPSRFVWDVFSSQFDIGGDMQAFAASVLRWRLMALLKDRRYDPELQTLARYLDADPSDLTRFQLAEKLAELFDQYQVYRPRMIHDWDSGHSAVAPTEAWQRYLWQLVCAEVEGPHRTQLTRQLIDRLVTADDIKPGLPPAIHMFALSALSPLYLNVLQALALHIDVYFYHLNPSRHYWGDMLSQRENLRRNQTMPVENELLASLGQQGREFLDLIYDNPFEYQEFERFQDIPPDSLLHRLQHDILNLQRAELQRDYAGDHSIQVVSCYSELRELQVLQDRLLSMLDQDSTLQAHDIVVMSPDIDRLAPYIEAVFSGVSDNRYLPHSISDHNPLAASALVQAILDWIRLPDSRLGVSEVLAWLEIPAVQKSYGLQVENLDSFRYWVKSNHIHWGVDADFKRHKHLGDSEMNTWQFGMQRLLTAYLMNDSVELLHDSVPSDVVISQAELALLGSLQHFVDDLAEWSARLAEKTTPRHWQRRINRMIDTFLQTDENEEWLLKPLRDDMAQWSEQAGQAGFDEAVDYQLVHQLMQNSVQQGAVQHQYLTGGVNFCNLIPMRSLPFRVVCLIGLGDEYFPRREVLNRFDLISRNPKKGDRSRREDDRYMFLQSLLSAQDVFYISYVGKNKINDSELQPSIVISELLDHIRQSTAYTLVIEDTALQVFGARNFAQGSYASEWRIESRESDNSPAVPSMTDDAGFPEDLDDLIMFYRNPARYYMKNCLNMRLYEFDDSVQDDEIFTLDPLHRHSLRQSMLNDLIHGRDSSRSRYLHSGDLPEKNLGQLQFEKHWEDIQQLHTDFISDERYAGETLFSNGIRFGHEYLQGRILSYSRNGLLSARHNELKGRHLFPLWIQHCFLCACEQVEPARILFKHKSGKSKWIDIREMKRDTAILMLHELIDGYKKGQSQPLPFYLDTAYAYESKKQSHGEDHARDFIEKEWSGNDFAINYEARDSYIQASLKENGYNGSPFSEQFFDYSTRFMRPLIDALRVTG